jgi:peptide/nickel transport system substrate-binding protein
MRKGPRTVALLCVVVVLASACGHGGGSTTGPTSGKLEPGGTLKLALLYDVLKAFDPQKEYYSVSWEFLRCCLTRTLLSYNGKPADQDGAKLFPDLAASLPTVSNDGLTWTFHLKDGIKFGPPYGTEITANDLIRGFERLADPQGSAGGYPTYYFPIKGFESVYQQKAKAISGLSAPDPKTLVIQLTQPTGDMGYRLAMPAVSPIPKGADVGHEKDYGQYLVSSGPYMFQGSQDLNFHLPPDEQTPVAGNNPDRSYVLVRNPDWDPSTDDLRPAYVNQIQIQVGGTAQDIQNKVDAGDMDMCFDCEGSPASALQKYATDPTLKDRLHVSLGDSISYSSMNVAVPPFDDVHVRRAFNWALDKNAIRLLGGGQIQGPIAGHDIPNGLTGNLLANYDGYPSPDGRGDIQKAMDEIKLSKYDTNHDGRCDESSACRDILTVADTGDPSPKIVAEVQSNLKPLGITLDVKFLSAGAMFDKCGDPAAHVGFCPIVSWGKDYPDAYTYGPVLFGSESIGPEACCNYSLLGATPDQLKKWGYSVTQVPDVDGDMAACEAKTGQDRLRCWADFDRQMTTEVVPWIPRRFANNIDIVGPRVLGYSLDEFTTQMAVDHVAIASAG